MLRATPATLRAARFTRVWVALCCLLSLTSSFNLTVLADVIDSDAPTRAACGKLVEVEEDIDKDCDMLSAVSADGRRAARKLLPPARDGLLPGSILLPVNRLAHSSRIAAGRAGSEHAGRNGLGVPLLC